MDLLASAKELRDAGRYREALEALDSARDSTARTSLAAPRAEVRERCGQNTEAARLAKLVLAAKGASFADRASCESVMGKLSWEHDSVDSALRNPLHSTTLTQHLDDSWQLPWSRTLIAVRHCLWLENPS